MKQGKTVARGYGADHKRRRRIVGRDVELGHAVCARCGRRILPGQAWDLGHNDFDRSRYNGPEHAYCNRAASGRRKKFPLRRSRVW
jgi:hypothetical protein